jgi:two-component system, response regulator
MSRQDSGPAPDVLLFESNKYDAHLFVEVVKRGKPDWTVKAIGDGIDAASHLIHTKELPRLIVMDIDLPRIDGLRLLAFRNYVPRMKAASIIVFTARSDQQAIREAMAFGAQEYVVKPTDPEQYCRAILKIIGQMPTIACVAVTVEEVSEHPWVCMDPAYLESEPLEAAMLYLCEYGTAPIIRIELEQAIRTRRKVQFAVDGKQLRISAEGNPVDSLVCEFVAPSAAAKFGEFAERFIRANGGVLVSGGIS